ncbi:MAG: outer membrane protein assembly factor BamA [Candidatus Polarisedimenticolaceae bacterium]|nr:outer membrane protein assembly factor BamA [Candidatus Polarisedimenticolaceae bacterium]
MIRPARFLLLILLFLAGSPQLVLAEVFTISDIRIEGLQRISVGTIFNYLPAKVGEELDTARTPDLIRALYQTGFFKDVQLERDENVLVVFVSERPAISKVDLTGNSDLQSDDLLQALKDIGMAEGRLFKRSILDNIEQELRRLYFSRGKYSIKIESTVTPIERNRVAVAIKISEGLTARIKRINVIGNEAFPDDELLDEFELVTSAESGIFSSSDRYSKQILTGDLEKLKSYYLDRGYIDFRIDSTQVSITPDKKDIYITVVVTEGEVFTVSDIKLAGELVRPKEEFFSLIKIKRGETFSRKKTTSSAERISSLLSKHGYAFANINSIPDIDREKREVSLTFYADPGKRVFVRRIEMIGNSNTRDEVLRREMRQLEAAWFSGEKVRHSRQRLQRLGYFENVEIETPAVPGSADQVDVNVNVTERASGNISAGIGYSETGGFIFNTSVTQNNFFGSGKRVSFALDTGDASTKYQLSFTNPYYTVDGVSRGYSLSYKETDFEELGSSNYSTDSGRAVVTFGVPISDLDRFAIDTGYQFTYLKVGDDVEKGGVIEQFELDQGTTFHNLSVGMSWTRDSRDRAIFPTDGARQRLSLETHLPGSDLLYYKLRYNQKRYIPLTNRLVFKMVGEVGYGDGYGEDEILPFFNNFFAGGIRSIRGFRANSLGPKDSDGDALGGNFLIYGQLELLVPMPSEELGKTMRLKAFYDIGNAYQIENVDEIELDDARSSAGVGLVWMSPVGALTFSWAKAIKSGSGDKLETFQFNLGASF